MKRILKIWIILFIVLVGSGAFSEDQKAIDTLFHHTSVFFQHFKGHIIELEGHGKGIIDIGSERGVLRGMRLKVYKPGVPFRHPVTGELIGTTDEPVGLIEVTDVKPLESKVRLIEGYMEKGYMVATQQEPLRVLFYQDTGVDYYWADMFHKKLSTLKALTLIDAPIEDYSIDRLYELADKKEADLILALSGHIEKDRMVVEERLIWADGLEIINKKIEVPLSEVRTLRTRSGEEIISMDKPLLIFTLPMNARMMSFGDFNGDQTEELAVATDDEITVYRLHPAELEEVASIEFSSSEVLLWLDSIDFDRDGRDEIVLTYYDGIKESPASYILKIESFKKDESEYKNIWKGEGFLRVFNGRLIFQQYSRRRFWGAGIYTLKKDKDRIVLLPAGLGLPENTDIYGFAMLEDEQGNQRYIIVDDEAKVAIYDNKTAETLPSDINLGGFDRKVAYSEDPLTQETLYWYIKDRVIRLGSQVICIRRQAVSEKAPGLGFKSSDLISIWMEEGKLKSAPLVEELSGSIRDFQLQEDKLYVLQSPVLGFSLKSLLSGRGLNATKIVVYQKRLKR